MKKWSGLVIFLVLVTLCPIVHATTIRINDFDLVDVAETSFEVRIEDASDFGAFQFDLYYDPSLVTIDSITLGDFLGSTGRTLWDEMLSEIDNSSGKVTFGAFTYLGPEGPSGDGTLATINFTLDGTAFAELSEAFTALDFDQNRSYVTDTKGTALSAQWADGKIAYTCLITATAGGGGTIEPSGEVVVECGKDKTFTITPNNCGTIADVLVNGDSVGAVSSYTFSDVQGEDNSISVTFAPKPPCTVMTSPGPNGSISPSSSSEPVRVACGASQEFTVTPDDCYEIVGGVSSHSFTCESGGTEGNISASFAMKRYTITSSAGPGGSITTSDDMPVDCGSDVTFTMTADAGYEIKDVLVDGVSVGAVSSHTFKDIRADHTIHVSFSDIVFIMDATTSGNCNGTITPSGRVAVDYGQDISFDMTASDCCEISDVLVDGVSVGAVGSYAFKDVRADHSIEAVFAIPIYKITLIRNEGGNISPVGGMDPLPSGDIQVRCRMGQTFNITPAPCYEIEDVIVDGGSVGPVSSYTFMNVREDHDIEAKFVKKTFPVSLSWDCAGRIGIPSENPDEPNGTPDKFAEVPVSCGENQEFLLVPGEGYHIGEVWLNGQNKIGNISDSKFLLENVTEAQRLHVVFFDDESDNCPFFTITADAGDGGNIEPSGEITVSSGEKVSFAITSDGECETWDVRVDGESKGAIGEYVFSNVFGDHHIHVEFKNTITVMEGEGGSITPSGDVASCKGSEELFDITPDACYKIEDVMVDGESKGPITQYAFSDIADDHTIEARFSDVIIKASAGCGGSISPSGDIECKNVDKLVITPDEGYEVCDVLVNGESQGAIAEYPISALTGDHVIFASFFSGKGDVNKDCDIGLADVILALKVVSGEENFQDLASCADADGDGKIGLEEAIFALQIIAGLRN